MRVRLFVLIGLLWAACASAQGTFTYTFSGDNSPLHVSATFQASEQAVATGLLTVNNINYGQMFQGGNTWSIFYLNIPVDPLSGQLIGPANRTKLAAYFVYDEIDVYGGLVNDTLNTMIVQWPYVGSPSNCSPTSGTWSLVRSVPEPSTASIVGLAGFIWVSKRSLA